MWVAVKYPKLKTEMLGNTYIIHIVLLLSKACTICHQQKKGKNNMSS